MLAINNFGSFNKLSYHQFPEGVTTCKSFRNPCMTERSNIELKSTQMIPESSHRPLKSETITFTCMLKVCPPFWLKEKGKCRYKKIHVSCEYRFDAYRAPTGKMFLMFLSSYSQNTYQCQFLLQLCCLWNPVEVLHVLIGFMNLPGDTQVTEDDGHCWQYSA